jgi:membrane-associated phospholipid phosphatase
MPSPRSDASPRPGRRSGQPDDRPTADPAVRAPRSGHLGQRLAAAATLAAVAAAPALDAHGLLRRADFAVLSAIVAHRPPGCTEPARRLTRLAEPPVVLPVVGAATVWATVRGRSPGTVATAACGIGVRRGLAEVIGRSRPPAAWWWDQPTGPSYPSRHVTWAALGYGATADLLAGTTPATAARTGCLAVTAAVAVTRVLLGVHWPSDVAAGIAFAASWRALTNAVASTPRDHRPETAHGLVAREP